LEEVLLMDGKERYVQVVPRTGEDEETREEEVVVVEKAKESKEKIMMRRKRGCRGRSAQVWVQLAKEASLQIPRARSIRLSPRSRFRIRTTPERVGALKEVLLMEGMKEEYAEEPKVEAALQVVVLGEKE
jgi:hypothetical protein